MKREIGKSNMEKTHPPGSTGLPFLGESLEFLRDPKNFHNSRVSRHGNVYTTHLFGAKTVILTGVEATQWFVRNDSKTLAAQWPQSVRSLLGPGCLSTIEGADHALRRKNLLPAFSKEEMEKWSPFIDELAKKTLEKMASREQAVVFDAIRDFAFRVAVQVIVGDNEIDREALTRDFQLYNKGLFVPLAIPIPGTPFSKAMAARKRIVVLIKDLIERRKGGRSRGGALETLLSIRDAEGKPLEPDEIVNEILLLLFAGHDTTVATLTNLLRLIQEKPGLMERESAFFQDDSVAEGEKEKRVDELILEGMRHTITVPGVFRKALVDVEFGDYVIPQGTVINFSFVGINRHPEVDNALEFDPDRPKEAYRCPMPPLTFGAGPRICLGRNLAQLEMRLFLRRALRDHSWEPVAGQDLSMVLIPMPRVKSGYVVNMRRRKTP